jgi:YD repeat-containing protein
MFNVFHGEQELVGMALGLAAELPPVVSEDGPDAHAQRIAEGQHTLGEGQARVRARIVTLPQIESYAAGRATEYDYDGNGNVTAATLIPADCATPASCGRQTLTSYDELDRPVRVVGPVFSDPSHGTIRPLTQLVYDALGNVKEVWAGRTDVTASSDRVSLQMSYLYDDFGRKVKETDALGRFWSFQYDKHGNLTQATDAKSQTSTFTWSYGHQLASRSAGAHVTQYTRNPLGQVLTAQSPEVTYTYSYYPANNSPPRA